ncbi:MAG: A/G-specific adenine glycosylase [Candidatus Hecatellales archaeon]|nr:MAG: A/G-specific adenine glycosylase [Candidatus Hecatellales archaeon]
MKQEPSDEVKKEFVQRIVEWYRQYGRHDLPWRRTSSPWQVLLAAVLLRKTTAQQVASIYPQLIEKFPDPASMADADEEELKKIIQPLGIEHQRARLLKELAKKLVEQYGGKVPKNLDQLKTLPGVGDYTAREVLCLAYQQAQPLLDRNMIRILERALGIKSEKKRPHTDKTLWKKAEELTPKDPETAKAFNLGILDLANKICTPRKPNCPACPIKSICKYSRSK